MFLMELVARQVSCRSASTGLSGRSGRARALVLTLRMAKEVVRVSYGRSLSGQFGLVTPGDLEGDLEPDRVVLYSEQAAVVPLCPAVSLFLAILLLKVAKGFLNPFLRCSGASHVLPAAVKCPPDLPRSE
ncbi:hypothetical protein C7M84_013607 [Penaeus vannamei]|uniref:Uncharacterized protein n=1 Tax=Penaeus vannamei TaxID=6689 RepID=A0A423SVP9_PENVA|nr:hypothetical protein C7M84_013607 [Penaeus vannamei]